MGQLVSMAKIDLLGYIGNEYGGHGGLEAGVGWLQHHQCSWQAVPSLGATESRMLEEL